MGWDGQVDGIGWYVQVYVAYLVLNIEVSSPGYQFHGDIPVTVP